MFDFHSVIKKNLCSWNDSAKYPQNESSASCLFVGTLKRVRSWSSRSRRKKTGDRDWTQRFRNWQSSCISLAALCAPSAASWRSVCDIQHIQKAGSVISWASTTHFTKIHFNIILLLIFMSSKFLCNQNITPNACYKSKPSHPLFNNSNTDTNDAVPSSSFSNTDYRTRHQTVIWTFWSIESTHKYSHAEREPCNPHARNNCELKTQI